MTRDSRCHELPREQKLDNGRLTTKMAETCFVKLPTLDDNLRKKPNVTDLLTYKAMTKQVKSLETLPAKMKDLLVELITSMYHRQNRFQAFHIPLPLCHGEGFGFSCTIEE